MSGHVEVDRLTYVLPDGRLLLHEVSFRVGDGVKAALVGPNGSGKTTLLRLIAGDLRPDDGRVVSSGGLGVMDVGGYDMEVVWDVCATEAMSLPYDAIRGRPVTSCREASRNASSWRPCCAARTRSCCWTSRTTTWTCPANSGWRAGCGPRAKPCCWYPTTAGSWPTPPTGS